MRQWTGILQADAYAGYNALMRADRLPAPLTRALCWSHARRAFFELADASAQLKKRGRKAVVIAPLAVEALRRIDAIFDIERAINGSSAQERLACRQDQSAALVADREGANARFGIARLPISEYARHWSFPLWLECLGSGGPGY